MLKEIAKRIPFAKRTYSSLQNLKQIILQNLKRIILQKINKTYIFSCILLSKIPRLKSAQNAEQYIVSLTSYGNRVKAAAPYAIYSIFKQSSLPDKIILWLDKESWNKNNIPFLLKKLECFGLEIRFCEDIKSYKKLIPALEAFPDACITTADDYVYYPKDWFEQLLFERNKNPEKIICHRAHGIKTDENHNPLPYLQWDFCIKPSIYFAHTYISQEQSVPRHSSDSLFPTGTAGTLYPPKCFYKDISNKELFMKLAPNADDIWFWAMAVINKGFFCDEIPYIVIENGYSRKLQFIDSQQQKGVNDKQFKAVIGQYPQICEVFNKITPFQSTNKEHFTPSEIKNVYGENLYLIHVFAYFLDCKYIKENNYIKIMDYACGDGYGSYFIANSHKRSEVTGIDIDKDALIVANSKYSLANLQFKHVSEISDKFDFIAAHQIIEHVDKVNDFLNMLKNQLSPNGTIIISTPQREYRLNDNQEPWSFGHKREYTKADFENEIKSVFPHAQIYQMGASKDFLTVEYGRVFGARKDKMVYGGVSPTQSQLNRKYDLSDLFLQSETTKDSINLFAIISENGSNEQSKIVIEQFRLSSNSAHKFNSGGC